MSPQQQIPNANEEFRAQQTKVEKVCAAVCNFIALPAALVTCVVVQVLWVIFGQIFKLDPYPFMFLLTLSNILQLILIFILAVGQKQAADHDEMRSEIDHRAITLILANQLAHKEDIANVSKTLQDQQLTNPVESMT